MPTFHVRRFQGTWPNLKARRFFSQPQSKGLKLALVTMPSLPQLIKTVAKQMVRPFYEFPKFPRQDFDIQF